MIHAKTNISRIEESILEAKRQIADGIIQGAVFCATGVPGIFCAGKQTVHPAETAMTENSRFDIASAGKIFTAGCCALLAAQGKLDPDAPFTKYIPEHVLGKSCPITVRDLAMHISGFDNSKPYDSTDRAVFLKELFAKKNIRPRLEAFEYSCSNMILLGIIAERISGLDLDKLARKMLWTPLGMAHTTWNAPGAGPHEVEHWYPNRPAGEHNDSVCFHCNFPIGSGSCFSTAGDLMLFIRDILVRGRFPREYYELIGTCRFDKDGKRRSFGWDMSDDQRPRFFSKKAIFHSGWTGQTVFADPETGFGAVVLTSRTGEWETAYRGRNRIVETLFQARFKNGKNLREE